MSAKEAVKQTVNKACDQVIQHQTGSQQVEVDSLQVDDKVGTFAELGIRPSLIAALSAQEIHAPTPVQQVSIPRALEGHDLLVQSRTGSGKTLAFLLPLIDRVLSESSELPQALVLAPTRELAKQIARVFETVCDSKKLSSALLYGGTDFEPQISSLANGAQIVIGTPGRVLDMIRKSHFRTQHINALVLDESDEMLSMGFLQDIQSIVDELPSRRQNLFFSATCPETMKRLIDRYMRDPIKIDLSEALSSPSSISHFAVPISGNRRLEDLVRVIEMESVPKAIIFCNTRRDVEAVAKFLKKGGYAAAGLRGDLGQEQRERILGTMRAGQLDFLVATDVAARGIDLPRLDWEINFGFPESAENYIHRTGRTGRAGRVGTAISLLSPAELARCYHLKIVYDVELIRRHLPSQLEIQGLEESRIAQDLVLRCGTAIGVEAHWVGAARRLLEYPEGIATIAGMIKKLHFLESGKAESSNLNSGKVTSKKQKTARRNAAKPDQHRSQDRQHSQNQKNGGDEKTPPVLKTSKQLEEKKDLKASRSGTDNGRRGKKVASKRVDTSPSRKSSSSKSKVPSSESSTTNSRKTTPANSHKTSYKNRDPHTYEIATGDIESFEFVDLQKPRDAKSSTISGASRPAGSENSQPASSFTRSSLMNRGKVSISVGSVQGVKEMDLMNFIQISSGIAADQLGSIRLFEEYCILEVEKSNIDTLVEKLHGQLFKGNELRVAMIF